MFIAIETATMLHMWTASSEDSHLHMLWSRNGPFFHHVEDLLDAPSFSLLFGAVFCLLGDQSLTFHVHNGRSRPVTLICNFFPNAVLLPSTWSPDTAARTAGRNLEHMLSLVVEICKPLSCVHGDAADAFIISGSLYC